MASSAVANTRRLARRDSRSATAPPARLPQPRPAMNAATTIVAARTSVPEKIASVRCQTTWYSSAAKPDAKYTISAESRIAMAGCRSLHAIGVTSSNVDDVSPGSALQARDGHCPGSCRARVCRCSFDRAAHRTSAGGRADESRHRLLHPADPRPPLGVASPPPGTKRPPRLRRQLWLSDVGARGAARPGRIADAGDLEDRRAGSVHGAVEPA